MTVIKAKFLIEDPVHVEQLIDFLRSQGVDVEPLEAVDVLDRYFDTVDWQVYQAGLAYRWREVSGKRTLRLKSVARTNGAAQEHRKAEQQVDSFPKNGHEFFEGPVAQQLRAISGDELRQRFQVRNDRRLFQLHGPDAALIELVVDHGRITTETEAARTPASGGLEFHELKLELKSGSEQAFQQIATTIQQHFGLPAARLSKFERGLQSLGLSPLTPDSAKTRLLEESPFLRSLYEQSLDSDDSVIKLVYRYLLEQFDQLLCEEPKAWEGLDPEGVHRMRVATRRIRAVFRTFKKRLTDLPIETLNEDLKWLAADLGRVRDLDVYQANLRRDMAEIPAENAACLAPYQAHLAEQWRQARKQLVATLSSARYEQFKVRFRDFLRTGPQDSPAAAKARTVKQAARHDIGKCYRRVLREGRAIDERSPDEAIHALRIRCKRLRYLFELFRSVYGSVLTPYIKRLKKLQDALGEFQDACVATGTLQAYADGVTACEENRVYLRAIGQLINCHRNQATARRAEFRQAWKRFDREGQRNTDVRALRRRLSARGVRTPANIDRTEPQRHIP